MIYYSLIHPYLTYCIDVYSSTYRTNLKTLCTAQKRSVRTLFATAQHPHIREISSSIEKFCLWTNWLINKVYLLTRESMAHTYDFPNHGDVRHHIQLRNICNLTIPLITATQSQLFVSYRAINKWNGLLGDLRSSSSICILSRINYNSCICLSHSF